MDLLSYWEIISIDPDNSDDNLRTFTFSRAGYWWTIFGIVISFITLIKTVRFFHNLPYWKIGDMIQPSDCQISCGDRIIVKVYFLLLTSQRGLSLVQIGNNPLISSIIWVLAWKARYDHALVAVVCNPMNYVSGKPPLGRIIYDNVLKLRPPAPLVIWMLSDRAEPVQKPSLSLISAQVQPCENE